MRTLRRRMIRNIRSLPTSYERLEYIENTSTAYIDCGLEPKHTFNYEIKTNAVTGNIVFGSSYLNNDHTDYRFFCTNGKILYFDVGYGRITSPYSVTLPYHAKFGNYYIQDLDNETNKVTSLTFGETLYGAKLSNLYLLFGYGNVKGKVWLLKINDNGKPIRDFIPAKRKSDGTIGMYDLVGRKFYTSPNGVAFSGG